MSSVASRVASRSVTQAEAEAYYAFTPPQKIFCRPSQNSPNLNPNPPINPTVHLQDRRNTGGKMCEVTCVRKPPGVTCFLGRPGHPTQPLGNNCLPSKHNPRCASLLGQLLPTGTSCRPARHMAPGAGMARAWQSMAAPGCAPGSGNAAGVAASASMACCVLW